MIFPCKQEVCQALKAHIYNRLMENGQVFAIMDNTMDNTKKAIQRRFGVRSLTVIDYRDVPEAATYIDYLTEREPLKKEKLKEELDKYRKARQERYYYRDIAKLFFDNIVVTEISH